jgi:hypothetical protein
MENAVPVGVRIDFPGATLEWYDKAIATAGFLPGGPLVNQAFSHWVTETDNGICIVEVWESREAFENNADEKGERIVEEVGVPGTPAIEFFEIYNYLPGRSPRA